MLDQNTVLHSRTLQSGSGTQAFSQEMYKNLIGPDEPVHWDNVKDDVLTCRRLSDELVGHVVHT